MTIWHLRTFIFLPEVLVRYEIRCNADFQEKSALYRIFDPHCCEFCPENKTALQRIRTDRDRTVGILTVCTIILEPKSIIFFKFILIA